MKGIVKEFEEKEQLVIKITIAKQTKKVKQNLIIQERNYHRIKLLSLAVNNIYMLIIYKRRILSQ